MADLREARAALVAREQDLRWCSKDDDCHTKAEGVALAISDFDEALAAEPTESLDVARVDSDELRGLDQVAHIMERHWHQGRIVGSYHAGDAPEDDCNLCRALVRAGRLTLEQIGSGTRAAIVSERSQALRSEQEKADDWQPRPGEKVVWSE